MSKRLLALVVAVLSLALVVAACGNDDNSADADSAGQTSTTQKDDSSMVDTAEAATGTDAGASELRATLTAALQEHVYLAGIAVTQGVGEGLDSKQFKASAATLDANSKALSDAIGSVYGDDAGEQFLALWRAHIGMFVDYTKGKATGDKKLVAKAKKDLDGYRTEFGAFLASANPNLTAEAVADELKPHVKTVFDTIDSVVAGKGDVFDNLREAAGHMPNTAKVLAGAIAQQKPDMFPSS